jgi:hypothetical protein
VVLGKAIPQPVKPFGNFLVGRAGERLRAGVDFDAGKDTLVREDLRERRSVGALLTDRLVVQDDTADERGCSPGGEEHFTVRPPSLLGRLDPERVESLGQGGDALVRREDALAIGDQRRRDALQILAHGESPPEALLPH